MVPTNEQRNDANATPTPLADRLLRALGPVFGGLVLDFADFATFGPLGLYTGMFVGAAAGWWVTGLYDLRTRWRLMTAFVAAVYMTMPATELLPLATVVSALARFWDESEARPDE